MYMGNSRKRWSAEARVCPNVCTVESAVCYESFLQQRIGPRRWAEAIRASLFRMSWQNCRRDHAGAHAPRYFERGDARHASVVYKEGQSSCRYAFLVTPTGPTTLAARDIPSNSGKLGPRFCTSLSESIEVSSIGRQRNLAITKEVSDSLAHVDPLHEIVAVALDFFGF